MTHLRRLPAILAMALLVGVVSGPGLADDEKQPAIQYDFSHPEEVFKDSMSESVVGAGIDPAALYRVLRAGQFVLINDHPNNPKIPWVTTEGTLINAPPEVVFGVIERIEEYPEFMPQTGKAWTKKVSDDVDQVFYELAIQVLFIKVPVPYSVYHWNRPPYRVDWVMASGDFKANIGAYEVVPVPGEDNRSMLFYTSYSLPRNDTVVSLFNKIPNLDMMINLSAGTLVVEAMKKRAESVYQKNGGKVVAPAKADFQDLIQSSAPTLSALASRGQMVMLEDTNPKYYTGVVSVKKPRDEVYKKVGDFAAMSTLSKNNQMKVLSRGDDTARVEIHTVVNLVIDFDSTYIVNYKMSPPERIDWTGEPGGDVEGVAGSWIFKDLGPDQTLVCYRNTSDLRSMGIAMSQLLKIEPSFEMAVQASQTILVVNDLQKWAQGKAGGK